MLRISRRGPICSPQSQSGIWQSGIRTSGIPNDVIYAASPDSRFACFAGTQKSLRILGVKSKESLQLSLRIGLPRVASGSAFGGLSAPLERVSLEPARSDCTFADFAHSDDLLQALKFNFSPQHCDIEFDMVFTVLSALSRFSLKFLDFKN